MSQLIIFIKKYPFALISIALFTPVFIHNPGISMANLFMLLGVIFFAYLYLAEFKHTKLIAVAVLLISVILYYCFNSDQYSYILAALSIISSLALVYVSMKVGFNEYQKKAGKKILSVGLAVIVLMPLVSILLWTLNNRENSTRIQNLGHGIESIIDQQNQGLDDKALALSKDQFIISLINERKYEDLLGYAQNYMVSQGISYVAIIDNNQKVLVRTHSPETIGDDYTDVIPAIGESGDFGGLYREGDRYFIGRVATIDDNGKIASLVVGQFIEQKMFSGLLEQGSGFAWLHDGRLENIVTAPDTNDFMQALSRTDNLSEGVSSNYLFEQKQIAFQTFHFKNYPSEIVIAYGVFTSRQVLMWGLLMLLMLAIFIRLAVQLHQQEPKSAGIQHIFRHNRNKTIDYRTLLQELLILIPVVSLVFWRSTIVYIADNTRSVDLLTSQQTIAIAPYLNLDLPTYVKSGDNFSLKIYANNTPIGVATIKFWLKYPGEFAEAREIVISNSSCDKVFDKSIDSYQGYINFSCVMKKNESDANLAYNVAEIKFIAGNPGIANFYLDQSYSSILTARGESNQIEQSQELGDNLIVY